MTTLKTAVYQTTREIACVFSGFKGRTIRNNRRGGGGDEFFLKASLSAGIFF